MWIHRSRIVLEFSSGLLNALLKWSTLFGHGADFLKICLSLLWDVSDNSINSEAKIVFQLVVWFKMPKLNYCKNRFIHTIVINHKDTASWPPPSHTEVFPYLSVSGFWWRIRNKVLSKSLSHFPVSPAFSPLFQAVTCKYFAYDWHDLTTAGGKWAHEHTVHYFTSFLLSVNMWQLNAYL